jgi:hypothetical protein
MTPDESIGTVVYVGEPDVVHELVPGRRECVFGRDPDSCDAVVWSALNDPSLSRRAGRIWAMDGQLWLRNLSLSHDLLVQVPGRPPEPYLPPRTDAEDPGPARSLPRDVCLVIGPGGCELVVRHTMAAGYRALHEVTDSELERTMQLPAVPLHLGPVAAALCAPLLAGGRLPATYAQIAAALGVDSHKRVRLQVAELCALYAEADPDLVEHTRARRDREERLVSALSSYTARRSPGGVWRFDERFDDGGAEEERRRRALALPDYFEVAHLLVRRGLVRDPQAEQGTGRTA